MPSFMIQGSYTPQSWATQISNPSDRLAATAVLAAFAGGAAIKLKTTQLLTADECIAALRKAGDIQYRPPTAG